MSMHKRTQSLRVKYASLDSAFNKPEAESRHNDTEKRDGVALTGSVLSGKISGPAHASWGVALVLRHVDGFGGLFGFL